MKALGVLAVLALLAEGCIALPMMDVMQDGPRYTALTPSTPVPAMTTTPTAPTLEPTPPRTALEALAGAKAVDNQDGFDDVVVVSAAAGVLSPGVLGGLSGDVAWQFRHDTTLSFTGQAGTLYGVAYGFPAGAVRLQHAFNDRLALRGGVALSSDALFSIVNGNALAGPPYLFGEGSLLWAVPIGDGNFAFIGAVGASAGIEVPSTGLGHQLWAHLAPGFRLHLGDVEARAGVSVMGQYRFGITRVIAGTGSELGDTIGVMASAGVGVGWAFH